MLCAWGMLGLLVYISRMLGYIYIYVYYILSYSGECIGYIKLYNRRPDAMAELPWQFRRTTSGHPVVSVGPSWSKAWLRTCSLLPLLCSSNRKIRKT